MRRKRLSYIILAVLLPALVMLLFSVVIADESATDMITLTITPESPNPVPAGDPAIFKVVLDNANGQNQPNIYLQLNWDKDLVQRAKVEMVEAETNKIGTQGVRRAEGRFRWQGGILKDGRLTLRVTLMPSICYDGAVDLTLTAQSGKQAGGQTLDVQETLQATCPDNPISGEDITTLLQIDTFYPNGVFDTEADILQGQPAHMRLQLTNNSDQPLNALATQNMDPETGREESCKVAASELQIRTQGAPTKSFDRGFLPPALNAGQADGDPLIGFMILELQPGETWTADLRLSLRGREPGCEFSGQAQVYPAPATPIPGSCTGASPECRYQGWSTRAGDLQNLFSVLTPYPTNTIGARLIASDLGDAPASENNFNIGMPAYPSVTANFPTVFNFNLGFPPETIGPDSTGADHHEAPFHLFTRPLRLGSLASREREADINPGRNLIPLSGESNLDLRDDGWPLGELPGACTPFTDTIPITVEPWAVQHLQENGGKAYLNIFVDANGDGDWADSAKCGNETVPEHIFINLPILVADLGAGQHQIQLPPNSGIMWETAGTWLRMTLSDEPAPLPLQTDGIQHGDGRGPEDGYLLGETEDYRFRVGNSLNDLDAFGADLALRLDSELMYMANHTAGKLASGFDIQATDCLTCIDPCYGGGSIVDIGNLGDLWSGPSKLTIFPDPSLRSNDVQISVKGDLPWTEDLPTDIACSPADPDCRIEIDLGEVPPRASGSLLVYASASCREDTEACKQTEYVVKAQIESANDANEENNEAQETTTLPLPPEWLEPPQIITPIPGTTAGSDLHIRGKGVPGRTVEIYLNGKKAAEGDVKPNGFFDIWPEIQVKEGTTKQLELSAGYKIPGGKRNPTRPISIILDNTGLFLDPISLTFTYDDEGNIMSFSPWDESGRVDPNGWILPYFDGSDVGLTLAVSQWYCLTCTLSVDSGAITLETNEKILATLTDPENDGTFQGSFKAGSDLSSSPLFLRLISEGQEQIYEGRSVEQPPLPKLIDGATGQVVDGADLTIWQAARVIGGEIIWIRPSELNGQPNPRTTNADGQFFFNVAPGAYRLSVIFNEGDEPILTEPQRLFGIYPSRNVVVNRPDFGSGLNKVTAGHTTVSIGPDGFNPPVLTVSPGQKVTFQNVSLQLRGAANEEQGINTGFISPGRQVPLTFNQAGTYQLVDPQDPQNILTLLVDPTTGGSHTLFLPLIIRP